MGRVHPAAGRGPGLPQGHLGLPGSAGPGGGRPQEMPRHAPPRGRRVAGALLGLGRVAGQDLLWMVKTNLADELGSHTSLPVFRRPDR